VHHLPAGHLGAAERHRGAAFPRWQVQGAMFGSGGRYAW
jgi:hypothetical protein